MILNHLFHGLNKVNQFLKDSVETAQARAGSSSEGEKPTRTIIYDVVLAVNDIAQAIKENFEEAKIKTDISVDFSADIDTNTVSDIKSDIKQTLQSIGGNLLSSTLASIAKGTGMLQALEQNNQNASSARSSGNTGGIFSTDSGYGSYYDGISSMFPSEGLGAGWRLVYGDTLRGEKTADYYARQYSEEFVNRQQYLGALIFMELADDVIENRNNPYGDIESRCTWSHDKWPTQTCAERKEEAIQACCHMWRGNIGQSIDKAMSTRAFNDVDLDHPEYYNPMDFFYDSIYAKYGYKTMADVPSPTEEEWEDIQLQLLTKLSKVYQKAVPWYDMWNILGSVGLDVPTDLSQARILTYTVKGQTFTFDLKKCSKPLP